MTRGIEWGTAEQRPPSILEYFWASRKWTPQAAIAFVLGTLSIFIAMFIVYRGYFGNVDTRVERSLVVGLFCMYSYLRFPLMRRWNAPLNRLFAVDLALFVLTLGTVVYTVMGAYGEETVDLKFRFSTAMVRWDHVVGIVVLLLLFEAVRRSFGWIMVIVPAFFLFYALFAGFFPGPLRHAQADWSYLMEILYVQESGVYGTGTTVLLSMVFLFLMFGTVMQATSVGAFFTSLANGLVGGYAGGPAKAAVVASAGIGTLTGSAIANVATTGCVTIPLMKKTGYKPYFAGAVEACASSGGQFMPPVMGVSAFLMVSFTGIPYLKICLYVLIPAVLYFLAIFLQVHFRAKVDGIAGLPGSELPSVRRVLAEGWYMALPLVVLIVALAIGYSATRVAIWGIAATLLLSFVRKETRLTARRMVTTLEWSVDSCVGISLCVIVVGVIVGGLTVSGLGAKLSFLVETLAAGNLFAGLVLAAVVSMILGMGLPTLMVYLLCVVFIIPALISMGLPVIVAHLFAFMFGAASMITPPVALAAFTAASIAGASMWKTGVAACRLGFVALLVPFMFAFDNNLVLAGTGGFWEIALSVLTATSGIVCIAAGFEGWLIARASVYQRALLFAAGIALVTPLPASRLAGAGLLLLMVLWQGLLARKRVLQEARG